MEASAASFPAFGGEAVCAATSPAALRRALPEVERIVRAYDRACSRFRDDSELTRLNRSGGRLVPVGDVLWEALEAALAAARLTGGVLDPTVGGALVGHGYDRDFPALRQDVVPRLVGVPGWRRVRMDRKRRAVFLPAGAMLDLGATAKALAADRAAARALEAAGASHGVLVSFSGDLSIRGVPPEGGWRVRVTDDHRQSDAPGQWIVLRDGGLATSSTSARRWRTRDGEAHHLIDPATGSPARGPWRTATVAAASCLQANVASTASLVRGEEATRWLEGHALPARLVGQDGRARHLGGWPRGGDELA